MSHHTHQPPLVQVEDLGRIAFADAWARQTALHETLVLRKRAIWRGEAVDTPAAHRFLFCEHDPVFTLGKSGKEEHLILPEAQLADKGFSFFRINRGGDITYHGPGQIVGYPILDLEGFYTDVHRYVRELEEVILRVLKDYGLEGERVPAYTGVWLPAQGWRPQRKICAIGVHLSRWVTLHGFAFNINTDLSHFQHIVPCGIKDDQKAVTSLQLELGHLVDMAEVKRAILRHFSAVFHCTLHPNS
jgi:lipoyl(octanoyl) transferase